MGMLGVTMAFTMRGCLSIAMTQMVVPAKSIVGKDREGVCPIPLTQILVNDTAADTEGDLNGRFSWDEETQGILLSAFYYGYIITHIPGGFLAQKFGGKFTTAYAIFSTSTLTLLTPIVARLGSTHLMVLRFTEGLGEVKSSV